MTKPFKTPDGRTQSRLIWYTVCAAVQKEALCVWAKEDVAKHTEALISYGSERSNDPLLQYYGFVIPDNPHETVKVPAPQCPEHVPSTKCMCGLFQASVRVHAH